MSLLYSQCSWSQLNRRHSMYPQGWTEDADHSQQKDVNTAHQEGCNPNNCSSRDGEGPKSQQLFQRADLEKLRGMRLSIKSFFRQG